VGCEAAKSFGLPIHDCCQGRDYGWIGHYLIISDTLVAKYQSANHDFNSRHP